MINKINYYESNSRDKTAQRANSIQWRVTLPCGKLSFIKKLVHLTQKKRAFIKNTQIMANNVAIIRNGT